MKLQKIALCALLLIMFFSSGCSNYLTPDERIVAADVLSAQAHLQKAVINTPTFPLLTYYRFSGNAADKAMLDVYIEGDGFAWFSRTQPSLDPTPINPVALKMAANSRQANVAYIARPCQYIEADNEKVCNASDWTNRRFSEQAVAAVNTAIDELKLKSGAQNIRLTGFSGGGAIAALVAARRNDVQLLITVAGNIEPVFWCEMHHLSPLKGSLNPAGFADDLQHIPQIHFVGEEDDNIPLAVAEAYRAAFKNAANIQIVTVPEFSHLCCWAEQWPQLLEPYLLLEKNMQ
jgi:dienelactone hydrolase